LEVFCPSFPGSSRNSPNGHRRGIPSARRVFRPVASGKSLGTRSLGALDRARLIVAP